MLDVQDQKHFDDVVAFARQIGLYEPDGERRDHNQYLKNRLDYLAHYAGKTEDGTDKTRARLFRDSAPYSFGFVIESRNQNGEWVVWFNGGLLFHGAHDENGSGAAPTFAVTLEPTVGWSIHT